MLTQVGRGVVQSRLDILAGATFIIQHIRMPLLRADPSLVED